MPIVGDASALYTKIKSADEFSERASRNQQRASNPHWAPQRIMRMAGEDHINPRHTRHPRKGYRQNGTA